MGSLPLVTRPTYPHASHPSTSNLPLLSLNLMLPTDCEEMAVLPRGLRTYLLRPAFTLPSYAQPQLPPSRITTGPGLGLLHLALKGLQPSLFQTGANHSSRASCPCIWGFVSVRSESNQRVRGHGDSDRSSAAVWCEWQGYSENQHSKGVPGCGHT